MRESDQIGPAILAARGISACRPPAAIFDPASTNPLGIPGLPEAVERLQTAIQHRQKIAIYADFDCDGICAGALLQILLLRLGNDPLVYFPDRLRDGYGLSRIGINACAAAGAAILLALDLGTNAQAEIDHAHGLGMDVIVVDHHVVAKPWANVCAAINPLPGQAAANFCSGALAFKLAEALAWRAGQSANDLIDLAAIATVGDSMELVGENRQIVVAGLARIAVGPRPGLAALLAAARIGLPLRARDIAFRIAPLINGAGRIGDPALACQLLVAVDRAAAKQLAGELVVLGRRRRSLSAALESELDRRTGSSGPVFYLAADAHPGIISSAATRLCARRGSPVYICAPAGEIVRGSGRTPDGLDAMAPLRAADPPPLQLGGHRQACGFSVLPSQVDRLAASVTAYWERHQRKWQLPQLHYDLCLDHLLLGEPALREIENFEPYGRGFAAPSCKLLDAEVDRVVAISNGSHLKIDLAGAGQVDVIWFGGGRYRTVVRPGKRVDLVGELARPRAGYSGISVIVEDLRLA